MSGDNLVQEERERTQFVCSTLYEQITARTRRINVLMVITIVIVGVVASLSISIGAAIRIHEARSNFQIKIEAVKSAAGLEIKQLEMFKNKENLDLIDEFYKEASKHLSNAETFSPRQLYAGKHFQCMKGYTINQAQNDSKWLKSKRNQALNIPLHQFMGIKKEASGWSGSVVYANELSGIAARAGKLDKLDDRSIAATVIIDELSEIISALLSCTNVPNHFDILNTKGTALLELNKANAHVVKSLLDDFANYSRTLGVAEPIWLAAAGKLTDTITYASSPQPDQVVGLRGDYENSKLILLADAANARATAQEEILVGGIPAKVYGVSFSLPIIPLLLAIPILLPILFASIITNVWDRTKDQKIHSQLLAVLDRRVLNSGSNQHGSGQVERIISVNGLMIVFFLAVVPMYLLLTFRAGTAIWLGWGFTWIGISNCIWLQFAVWLILILGAFGLFFISLWSNISRSSPTHNQSSEDTNNGLPSNTS